MGEIEGRPFDACPTSALRTVTLPWHNAAVLFAGAGARVRPASPAQRGTIAMIRVRLDEIEKDIAKVRTTIGDADSRRKMLDERLA